MSSSGIAYIRTTRRTAKAPSPTTMAMPAARKMIAVRGSELPSSDSAGTSCPPLLTGAVPTAATVVIVVASAAVTVVVAVVVAVGGLVGVGAAIVAVVDATSRGVGVVLAMSASYT